MPSRRSTFTPPSSRVHARALAWVLVLSCALGWAGCGEAEAPSDPSRPGWTPDPARATEAGRMSRERLAELLADPGHAHDGENAHEHGLEHGHSHDGEAFGPPPVDVGPAEQRGVDGALLVRLSRVDEPDFGFVAVRRGGAEAPLAIDLARDRDRTLPLEVPAATRAQLRFADHPERTIALQAAGAANARTRGFAAAGLTAAEAAWLRSGALVRITLVVDGEPYVSDDFALP